MAQEEPHVTPHEVRLTREGKKLVRTVRIWCPYCGNRHTHGWGLDSTEPPGGRVAHCSNGRNLQYYIDLPPLVEVNE